MKLVGLHVASALGPRTIVITDVWAGSPKMFGTDTSNPHAALPHEIPVVAMVAA